MILVGLLFFLFSPGVFYTIPPWFCNEEANTSLIAAAVHALLFGIVYHCIFKELFNHVEGFQSGNGKGGRKKEPFVPKLDIEDVETCAVDKDCKANLTKVNCRSGRCKS